MDNYQGVIIEESLEDKNILADIKILDTKVERVVEKDKTPWVKKWTLHTVEIAEDKADDMAEKIRQALDSKHEWYADFKNETTDYIIFKNKIFKINRADKARYKDAREYGVSIGIPEHQVSFRER